MSTAEVLQIRPQTTLATLVSAALRAFEDAKEARQVATRTVDRREFPADMSEDDIHDAKVAAKESLEVAVRFQTEAIETAITAVEMSRNQELATDDEIDSAIRALRKLPLTEAQEGRLLADPDTVAALDAHLAARSKIPKEIDDSIMAEAFARTEIMGRYLYVAARGRWYRWTGRHWAVDDTEAIHEHARLWVVDLGRTMFELGEDSTSIKKVANYRSRSKLEAIVTLARRVQGIAARPDEFDADPDVLNVANGIIDLPTGRLFPHDPEARLTKITDVKYNPDAEHPDVEQLLEVVDDDVRPFVLALLGYAATGHTSEDVIAVFDGGGANGKTSLLEAVAAALGDYAGPVAPQLIMRSARDEHPTIKADLQGKRAVFVSETEEGGAFRMEQLKALTGGDRIKARVMRGDYFDFTPTHTLIVATNHRPFVNATDHGSWRRLKLVPFPHTYKPAGQVGPGERAQDPKLRQRLVNGRDQREAMLAWIVAGAVSWYRNGLPSSPTVDTVTSAWRMSEDVILRFIDEELTFDADAQMTGRELYVTYTDWCRNEGRPAKSNKNFATEFLNHESVETAGVARVNVSNTAVYRGLRKAS